MSAALISPIVPTARQATLDRHVLARLRFILLEQRRFRLDQLAEIERSGALRSDDVVTREVARSLAAGARTALADVCEALRLMQSGRYGACRDCGAALPSEHLEVLPHITRCPACLRSARGI